MKKLFFILCLLPSFLKAQTPYNHQKIAQSHYAFSNNNWQGVDSVVFNFNTSGFMFDTWSSKFTNSSWLNLQRNIYHFTATNKVDTQYRQNWNGSMWVTGSIFVNIYDANDSIIEADKLSATYTPQNKIVYTYNTLFQLQTETNLNYSNGTWVYNSKILYNYDLNSGLISDATTQLFDATYNVWVNSIKKYYGFDANNKLTFFEQYLWQNGMYQENLKIINLYNANNQLIISQASKDSADYFDYKTEYTYTNNLLSTSNYSTGDTNNVWTAASVSNYTYYPNNLVKNYSKLSYVNTVLQNDTMVDYSYNSQNLLYQTVQQNGYNNSWGINVRSTYSYDTDSNNTMVFTENYVAGNYVPFNIANFYYNSVATSTSNIILPNNTIILYPNPTYNHSFLEINSLKNESISINVLTSEGKKILTIQQQIFAGKNTIEIPLQFVTAGSYFIQYQSNHQNFSSKITKQ